MIQVLKFTFQGNPTPVFLPVTEEESSRVRDLLTDRGEPLGFMEGATVFGQHVWLRFARVSMVNFLIEPRERIVWNEDDLAPSTQYPDTDSDTPPEYGDIRWDVLIYTAGNSLPLRIVDCDGDDWVEITTSIDCEEHFIVVTDDDGEDVAIPVASIDLVVGTEVERYTPKQIEHIQQATLPEEMR